MIAVAYKRDKDTGRYPAYARAQVKRWRASVYGERCVDCGSALAARSVRFCEVHLARHRDRQRLHVRRKAFRAAASAWLRR